MVGRVGESSARVCHGQLGELLITAHDETEKLPARQDTPPPPLYSSSAGQCHLPSYVHSSLLDYC